MKFTGNAKSDPNSCFPAGDQFLTCTYVQDKDKDGNDLKSKAGNDMWILELTVAEGDHKDRKLWFYLVWLPPGAAGHGMILKALKAFGLDPEGENDIQPDHLLNVTVKAFVKIDESEGYEPKNAIGKWFSPDELVKPAPFGSGTAQEPEKVPAGATDFKEGQGSADPAKPPAQPPKKKSLWGKK